MSLDESAVAFLDLPTEILYMILKKLNNMHMLYSLFGVDQRLDTIASNIIFTQSLNFVLTKATIKLRICQPMLNRFCIDILPQIHQNVKTLTVHSESMERILRAADFLNLSEIRLYNVRKDTISRYFTDQSPLQHLLRKQITVLIFLCLNDTHITSDRLYIDGVSTRGLSVPLSLPHSPLTACSSQTLRKLCVCVKDFGDCLALLDGRLENLTTFIVNIDSDNYRTYVQYKQDQLPNLKHFLLKSRCETMEYDTQIVPLIRRMFNLEELTMNIEIKHRTRFVDGVQINDEILVYLSKLHHFICYINTEVNQQHLVHQLSEDEIQRTLSKIKDRQITCTVTQFPYSAQCQVFSLPFAFDTLQDVGHTCPSVSFSRITYLSLRDNVPFEHEFFLRIARCFPMLKEMRMLNFQPQSNVLDNGNSRDNQLCPIAEYPHLTRLDLACVHPDYIDEFLDETKTRLPRLIKLEVIYELLQQVTENFTRNATRLNCANVKQLTFRRVLKHSKDFYTYFPRLSSRTCFSTTD